MKKILLISIIILSVTQIFAQGINYEHLSLSKKELNNLLLNNGVDIVFSSGILLTGVVTATIGSAICYKTYQMELPFDDPEPDELHDPGANAPILVTYLTVKLMGYALGGGIALGGLGISSIGLHGLSKSIQINKRLRKIKINLQDMSIAGRPGIGIGLNIPLNSN